MAFATTNVKLESNGSLWYYVGECTASVGDADGTLTVGGARVYSVAVIDLSHTTAMTQAIPVKVSEASSGNNSTITVNCSAGITRGRFVIIFR